MANDQLRALSAVLKYGDFRRDFVLVDAQNKRWVKVDALLASKKRFLALNKAEAVQSMMNEVDERGRRRFRLFTDVDGIQWINALNRSERESNLF